MFVVDNKREGERLCGKWNEGWWMGSQLLNLHILLSK